MMLHAKPCPIGPQRRCSTHCVISNPLALLLSPARAVLPQTPTPQTAQCPPDEPLRTARTGIHSHSQSPPVHILRPARSARSVLCWVMPPRPFKPPIYTCTSLPFLFPSLSLFYPPFLVLLALILLPS
jgi:hypothetical protein